MNFRKKKKHIYIFIIQKFKKKIHTYMFILIHKKKNISKIKEITE